MAFEKYADHAAALGEQIFGILGKHLSPRRLEASLSLIDALGVGDLWPDERFVATATGPYPDNIAGEYPHEDYLNQVIRASAVDHIQETTPEKRLAQKTANILKNVGVQRIHVSDLTAELVRLCGVKGIPVPTTPTAPVWVVTGEPLTDAIAELASVTQQFAEVAKLVQDVRGDYSQTFGPPAEPTPTEPETPAPLPDGSFPGPGLRK